MKTTITELMPPPNGKKFYGKAQVIEQDGVKYLKSYDTVMASVKNGEVFRHADWRNPDTGRRSPTTGRHLRAFIDMFADNGMTVGEFYELPITERPELRIMI